MYPAATRLHSRKLRGREELVPRTDAGRRQEVDGKTRPVVGIMAAQQLDPTLLGDRAGGLCRVKDEQGAGPPADLVIREIADPIGTAAIGGDELAGERVHAGLGVRR